MNNWRDNFIRVFGDHHRRSGPRAIEVSFRAAGAREKTRLPQRLSRFRRAAKDARPRCPPILRLHTGGAPQFAHSSGPLPRLRQAETRCASTLLSPRPRWRCWWRSARRRADGFAPREPPGRTARPGPLGTATRPRRGTARRRRRRSDLRANRRRSRTGYGTTGRRRRRPAMVPGRGGTRWQRWRRSRTPTARCSPRTAGGCRSWRARRGPRARNRPRRRRQPRPRRIRTAPGPRRSAASWRTWRTGPLGRWPTSVPRAPTTWEPTRNTCETSRCGQLRVSDLFLENVSSSSSSRSRNGQS